MKQATRHGGYDGRKDFIMAAKERQIWFWQKEVEARLFAWKENLKRGDSEGAKQAKRQYIEARKTLEELGGDKQ